MKSSYTPILKLLIALLLVPSFHVLAAQPAPDTSVYWNGTGKRVHVEGCRRLTKDPAELAKLQKLTFAEAETKGLPLCSRCPGSTTGRNGESNQTDTKSFESSSIHTAETKVYHAGKKRVHVEGCRRLDSTEGKTVMTLGEAEAKGLPLCSRCPGSTTAGRGNPKDGSSGGGNLPESWVNPPPVKRADDWKPEKATFVPSERAPLVSLGSDGHIVYKPYSDRGDRIIDFSYCGYHMSEVPLPNVPVKVTLDPPTAASSSTGNMKYPVGKDSFETIQSALDRVAAMKPDARGHRGAVLLKKGTWYVNGALLVQSGVVLRGEGDGEDGTILIFTPELSGGVGIQIGESGSGTTVNGSVEVTGVVSGMTLENGNPGYRLTLDDGSSFRVRTPRSRAGFSYDDILNERVALTFTTETISLGGERTTTLRKTFPESFKRLSSGQSGTVLPEELELPLEQKREAPAKAESEIVDVYIPSGSTQLTLKNASGFKVGDHINIQKTTNEKWIEVLGVGERLRHIRAGKEGANKRPWGPQTYSHYRQIVEIEGNTISFVVPLPQSIEQVHGGGKVLQWMPKRTGVEAGVESLCVVSNYDTTVEDTGKDANFQNMKSGVQVTGRQSWVRDVTVKHVWFSAVNVSDSQHITVRDCKSLEPVGPERGGRRYPFNLSMSMGVLYYNCYSVDGRHDFVVGARTPGPNAFLKCTALRGGQSEPHHRWGSGVLYDNITKLESGSLAAINRGDSGSGHGWAAANTVFWNCNAPKITVFNPETVGENNFVFGYTGDVQDEYDTSGLYYANTRAGYWGTPQEGKYYGFAIMGNGHIESPTAPVEPRSLFVQQLIDRIGEGKAMSALE